MADRYPRDTDKKIYLPWAWDENSLQDLIQEAQRKWFGVDFNDVKISCEQIQTSGCGCHAEWGDFTTYITLELKEQK